MSDSEEKKVTTKKMNYRVLPWCGQMVWFPVTLLTAALHFICKPLGIEPIVSSFITGGFFGMVLIPILFVLSLARLSEMLGVVSPEALRAFTYWAGMPFLMCYAIVMLLWNEQHLDVERSDPHPARNALERASADFLHATLDYFPITCAAAAVPPFEEKKDAAASDKPLLLPPDRQYVFAVHPHGIHCTPLALFSTPGSDFDKQFPGLVNSQLTGLAATVMFKLPLVKELFLHMGYVDASRSVASKVLEAKRSIFVCTGGEEEAMYTTKGRDIVVLKNRKGFIRLALSYGADIVPVFGVGNSDLFETYSFLLGARMWIQKNFGIAIPIFHGRWGSPLPYQRPVQVLIGEPIATPAPKVRGYRPDEKLVDEYHVKYVQALKALHAQHVTDRTLEIR